MRYAGNAIVIIPTIALVAAVAWVLYHVGRIVISIIVDARADRQPAPKLHHPEFGALLFSRGLWDGTVQRDGKAIHFYVSGNQSAPNVTLLERLQDAIARFPHLESAALDYIRSQQPEEFQKGRFTFQSMDFLFEKNPSVFAMEFCQTGDDDGVWRVEFESGQPKSVGRDD